MIEQKHLIAKEKYYVSNFLNKIGFKDFELLFENELPFKIDDDFNYIIDVLPYRVDIEKENYYIETIDNEIPRTSFNDLEDFYNLSYNKKKLEEKWIALLLKIAYYYKLKNIIIYISPKNKLFQNDISEKVELYMSLNPINIMKNISKFLKFLSQEMYSSCYYFYFDNGLCIEFLLDEIFLGIHYPNDLYKSNVVENLKILSSSEGLFLIKK